MLDMSKEEAEALNATTREELDDKVQEGNEKKNIQVSSALQKLINVTESESIKVVFTGPAGEANLEIRANPSQKTMQDLVRISKDAEDGREAKTDDEDKLCKILEYLTIDPVIPFAVWKSGELPEEIAARIIVELVKYKAIKQDDLEDEIGNFRKIRRGAKTA